MQKFEFEGSQGFQLAARLDKPEGKIKSYALFAHCFTGSKDVSAASQIAKALNEKNIAVVRFDFTGLGNSDGDFSNTNFTSNIEDLVKCADYMRDHINPPSILVGHSLGGAAILSAAKHIPEVKAVATIGAPADSAHVAHHFEEHRDEIFEKGEAHVCLAGRPFKIKKQFIEDIENQTMQHDIAGLNRALMIMHAPLDEVVGIENAGEIFKAAKHPKSYISLDDADHMLNRREDTLYVGHLISEWASRYIS